MLGTFRDWFYPRTGYRPLVAALLIEHIPGGAKWRYVWGSCLAFVFGVQLITGVLLMTAYSPCGKARPIRPNDRSDERRLADLEPRLVWLLQRRRWFSALHQQ